MSHSRVRFVSVMISLLYPNENESESDGREKWHEGIFFYHLLVIPL